MPCGVGDLPRGALAACGPVARPAAKDIESATECGDTVRTQRHDIGLLIHAETPAEWRKWLSDNHDKEQEAWLVMHTKASGRPFVEYNDAVDEALCVGWIDSTVKSIGDGARAQRYTPRRRNSAVSEMNKARVRRLVREGRMTDAGRAALPDLDEWLDPPTLVVASDIEQRIRSDPDAWRHYREFPEAYKRIRIGWIEGARGRPDEFEKRLAHFVKMTARGKRYGMVQS